MGQVGFRPNKAYGAPLVHVEPSRAGRTHHGTFRNLLEYSDTISEDSRTFQNPKTTFSLSPDHSGAPRHVPDPIRDSELYSVSPS